MSKIDEKPVVITKRKNIQTLFDYCLDQRLIFTISPRAISNDEFEVEIEIEGIKQAIALGMFVKENKYEVPGMGELARPKTTVTKKVDAKDQGASLVDLAQDTNKDDGSTLNFDLNVSNN